MDFIWRGARNKALSDFWCKVRFSFYFTSDNKKIWKEILAVCQKSLKAFFQAPLHLVFGVIDTNNTILLKL